MNRFFCTSIPVAVLVTLLALGMATAGGRLYMLSPKAPFWPDTAFPVPYNLNPVSAAGRIQGPDPSGQFAEAAMAAFDTWEAIPTSRITFLRGPDTTDTLDLDPADGQNLIVFHGWAIIQGIPIPLPPGVLAITNTVFDPRTGEIQGGAITLNPDPLPDDPGPDWSTSGMPGSLDVQAVILHEAGHLQGLCHSNVRNDTRGDLAGPPSHGAVMFPFLAMDITDARTPDPDDVAWHGLLYPSDSYGSTFGSIEGNVPFGSTMMMGCGAPRGVNGAHVVARDLNVLVGGQPRMIVGTYSYRAEGRLGHYTIPGLPPGEYGVWIEPMDGSPVAALQVNTRIQFTLDTDFPEDWYSGDEESGAEGMPGNPASAVPVAVAAGAKTTGIDVIVEDFVPSWCMSVAGLRGPTRAARPAVINVLVFLMLPAAYLYLVRTGLGRRTRKGPKRETRPPPPFDAPWRSR